ncbi:beta-N-acetylhexosaminidase [Fulvitalea axinellae]|uniref:beta-N-acetylhexosaminidase n=1 Tax=Fulvitalea axinellae TaxID=1182444 RepID=A0AAU9CQN7_9BACT|nr:beta-N-acetylhexosaminidase [Fulvitalea axinellae]
MRLRGILASALAVALCWACSPQKEVKENTYQVIPKPASLTPAKGVFTIEPGTAITLATDTEEARKVADFLSAMVENATGKALEVKAGEASASGIVLSVDAQAHTNPEGYTVSVNDKGIAISAPQAIGLMYGVQTVRQLLPTGTEGKFQGALEVPYVSVKDAPRYKYRGMHLDVGRHIFPVKFIKKYIDMIAMFKMNTFHWHLTEDQGWRIEIKKYPKLAEVASKRKETLVGHMGGSTEYDGKEYGGYYTQEEVKEIVKYASDRFVTIIPEIELPGHSVAALAAYPELGCTGGPYEVRTKWGISKKVYCAGNEKTFAFLEDVLSEVLELFPSKYIHIGGDECPKDSWKKCKKCQKRKKEEGLKDEHELQSYFIARAEKFLNSKGRAIIGWDEILEGGLAPNATVMSWRGMKGGIEAAKEGHDVIMTPGSHCYFDHYQADKGLEPLAIGGFTTVQKVYSFEPTPAELDADKAKHVLGAQGNVWTEYMKTPEHVEYMAFPRMIALSEVVWSPKESRNWDDFSNRLFTAFERLDILDVNYAKAIYNVEPKVTYNGEKGNVEVALKSPLKDVEIRYTVDGTEPTAKSSLYAAPFGVDKTSTIKAGSFKGETAMSKAVTRRVEINKATGKDIKLDTKPEKRYAKLGAITLVDGIRGSDTYGDGKWLGFRSEDLSAVIDLKESTDIKNVTVGALADQGAWIFLPSEVTVSVSADGKTYKKVGEIKDIKTEKTTKKGTHNFDVKCTEKARFVKVEVKRHGKLPEWHSGAGKEAHLFVDNINID